MTDGQYTSTTSRQSPGLELRLAVTRPSHGWISQKRLLELALGNFHRTVAPSL